MADMVERTAKVELYPMPNNARTFSISSPPVSKHQDYADDAGSGEELIDARSSPKAPWQPRPALLVLAALLGTVLLGWSATQAATARTKKEAPTTGHTARQLLQSPELTGLIADQVRRADRTSQGLSQAALHHNVLKLMDDLGAFIDDNLEDNERLALRRARIDPGMWDDMNKVFDAIHHPEVMELGRRAFLVASNVTATPSDMQQLLHEMKNDAAVTALRSRVIPHRFRARLKALGKMKKAVDLGFSPEALQEMRQQDRTQPRFDLTKVSQELVPTDHVAGVQRSLRRLGAARQLGAQTVLGIVALSLTGAMEIFVQLQVLFDDFHVPGWVWAMMIFPAFGTSGAECGIYGFDDWCSFTVGILGMNALQVVEEILED